MTDGPGILYTVILGVACGAFALLRLLATERRDRLDLIRAHHEAEAAAAEKQPASK